jgi:predicted transcriptional regulator of viral defense system
MTRKVSTPSFFGSHPVFSLDQAALAFGSEGGRTRVLYRLKHHLKTGRLKAVTRGVYAVVPPGASHGQARPDPVMVAAALRPDAVFSHHTALELLGAAHSVWQQCTLYTASVRRPLKLPGVTTMFLAQPTQFRGRKHLLGTQQVERAGVLLRVTGRERALVEGFRRPALAGGLEELVASASGFAVLDLTLLERILRAYGVANLWAATGWFLERFQSTFHVPDRFLALCERRRPRSPQYLERGTRGGVLASRWNLILPEVLVSAGEPDER